MELKIRTTVALFKIITSSQTVLTLDLDSFRKPEIIFISVSVFSVANISNSSFFVSLYSVAQFSRLVKYVATAGSLQGTHNFAVEPARYYSSEPSLQETQENGSVNLQLCFTLSMFRPRLVREKLGEKSL